MFRILCFLQYSDTFMNINVIIVIVLAPQKQLNVDRMNSTPEGIVQKPETVKRSHEMPPEFEPNKRS